MIRMLVCIFVLFAICWSPLESMLLFMEYSREFPAWWPQMEWIAYFLAYANTALNPFVYVGLSENFREALGRLRTRLFSESKLYGHNELNIAIVASQIYSTSRYRNFLIRNAPPIAAAAAIKNSSSTAAAVTSSPVLLLETSNV